MAKSEYHHGDLENAIIETATKLLEVEGNSDISIRRIAKELGVSHQAPYQHFSSKSDVINAVREKGFDNLALACRGAETKFPDSPFLQLQCAANAYVKFAIEYPTLYNLMFGMAEQQIDGNSVRQSTMRSFEALAKIIQQSTPPFSKTTVERSRLFWAMGHGIASLAINGLVPKSKIARTTKLACRELAGDWF